MPQSRERIVLPNGEPELAARREQAIRFVHAAGNQIVDEHPDIAGLSTKDDRLAFPHPPCRVHAGDHPLTGRFLIPRGPIHLPREIQPLYRP